MFHHVSFTWILLVILLHLFSYRDHPLIWTVKILLVSWPRGTRLQDTLKRWLWISQPACCSVFALHQVLEWDSFISFPTEFPSTSMAFHGTDSAEQSLKRTEMIDNSCKQANLRQLERSSKQRPQQNHPNIRKPKPNNYLFKQTYHKHGAIKSHQKIHPKDKLPP